MSDTLQSQIVSNQIESVAAAAVASSAESVANFSLSNGGDTNCEQEECKAPQDFEMSQVAPQGFEMSQIPQQQQQGYQVYQNQSPQEGSSFGEALTQDQLAQQRAIQQQILRQKQAATAGARQVLQSGQSQSGQVFQSNQVFQSSGGQALQDSQVLLQRQGNQVLQNNGQILQNNQVSQNNDQVLQYHQGNQVLQNQVPVQSQNLQGQVSQVFDSNQVPSAQSTGSFLSKLGSFLKRRKVVTPQSGVIPQVDTNYQSNIGLQPNINLANTNNPQSSTTRIASMVMNSAIPIASAVLSQTVQNLPINLNNVIPNQFAQNSANIQISQNNQNNQFGAQVPFAQQRGPIFWRIVLLVTFFTLVWVIIYTLFLGNLIFGIFSVLNKLIWIFASCVAIQCALFLPLYMSRAWWCECYQCYDSCSSWRPRNMALQALGIVWTLVCLTVLFSSIVLLFFSLSIWKSITLVVLPCACVIYVFVCLFWNSTWFGIYAQRKSCSKLSTRYLILFALLFALTAAGLFTLSKMYCFIPCDQTRLQGMIRFAQKLAVPIPPHIPQHVTGYCHEIDLITLKSIESESACVLLKVTWIFFTAWSIVLTINAIVIKIIF